ncbi:hypothetical protein TRFO_31824 [Tritrichomonas foetus]|uniref:Uncharacterized protein n=1 Tax=Tritrichomonas foetus TaxID=1144522 RepID=A0A1J4JQF1_9EUKA|nr:hypothetical protein TRFO_31824 [Tritrichomonas foetus]|eukprot:OHT01391.1 hypothetical protein TRFO_31824 [Tritrichomonas foetus]
MEDIKSVETDYNSFCSIDDDVSNGKMSAENGEKAISNINFLKFDMIQMRRFRNANWISDEFVVNVLNAWLSNQNQVLREIQSNLVFTPNLTKKQFSSLVQNISNPSEMKDLIVNNLIYQIATKSSQSEYVNPLKSGLISCKTSDDGTYKNKSLMSLFDNNSSTSFISQPRKDAFIIISLPSFLRLQLFEYSLTAPIYNDDRKFQGSISSWSVLGSNDLNSFSDVLSTVTNNNDLSKSGAQKTFKVDKIKDGCYYQHFKIVQTSLNHVGNLSIPLAGLDLSGKVLIVNENNE